MHVLLVIKIRLNIQTSQKSIHQTLPAFFVSHNIIYIDAESNQLVSLQNK